MDNNRNKFETIFSSYVRLDTTTKTTKRNLSILLKVLVVNKGKDTLDCKEITAWALKEL